MKKQQLLNTYVNNVNWSETLQGIEELVEKGTPSYIVEVNVDVVVKLEQDSYLKKIVRHADMVLVDGKPLQWIAKWQRRPIKEKISGSDLVREICRLAEEKGYSLFIMGGGEGVAGEAAKKIKEKHPGIRIAGHYAPSWGFEKDEKERKAINAMILASQADILFVCLGCPKQEKWIYENYKACGAKVSVCAGASVDFLAERIKRAPRWMSNHGLEWFYRFLKEPRRLFKRYFIDDVKIVGLMWRYRRKKI